jgi:hypothetical protein
LVVWQSANTPHGITVSYCYTVTVTQNKIGWLLNAVAGAGAIAVSTDVPTGVFGGFKLPRNSEVLKKLSQIPSSVEYTSVTT